jgi:hypothetical protein
MLIQGMEPFIRLRSVDAGKIGSQVISWKSLYNPSKVATSDVLSGGPTVELSNGLPVVTYRPRQGMFLPVLTGQGTTTSTDPYRNGLDKDGKPGVSTGQPTMTIMQLIKLGKNGRFMGNWLDSRFYSLSFGPTYIQSTNYQPPGNMQITDVNWQNGNWHLLTITWKAGVKQVYIDSTKVGEILGDNDIMHVSSAVPLRMAGAFETTLSVAEFMIINDFIGKTQLDIIVDYFKKSYQTIYTGGGPPPFTPSSALDTSDNCVGYTDDISMRLVNNQCILQNFRKILGCKDAGGYSKDPTRLVDIKARLSTLSYGDFTRELNAMAHELNMGSFMDLDMFKNCFCDDATQVNVCPAPLATNN